MLSNIKEFFGDLDFFSKQVAEVDLSTIMFEQYDFSKGYMAIDTIFTKCDQFLNIKEAFAAIFCKELHDNNFIKKVEYDLESINVTKTAANNLFMKITDNPKVIRLKKGHVYEKFFCQNNDYYFIYEWGIYA